MSENAAPNPRALTVIAVLLLVIALIGAFFLGSRLTGGTDHATRGVLTSGKGSVTATPDQLTFSVTVTNNAAQTASAMSRTNAGVRGVKAVLLAAGVADKDISTQSISVQPNYDYSGNSPKLAGYTSTQSLSVLVRNLSTAGSVMGSAATAAGNTVSIGDIAMSVSKQSTLLAEARTKAINDSHTSAQALADAAGRHLGKAVYIEEVTGGDVPVMPYASTDALSGSGAAASKIPISPGSQKVTVNVKVRWTFS